MSKLSKISIGTTTAIPIDKYRPVKVYVSVTHDKENEESDEEAFAEAYKDLNEIREAAVALEMKKRVRTENSNGMLSWGYKLLDDLQEGSRRFYDAFINLIKK